jgi:hypothetical protein
MGILGAKLRGLRRKFRLDGASVHQRLVFLLRFTRQENPHRAHTHRRPYGNINEQNEERQNQRQDAGPRFKVQQAPTRGRSQRCSTEHNDRDHTQQRTQKDRKTGAPADPPGASSVLARIYRTTPQIALKAEMANQKIASN